MHRFLLLLIALGLSGCATWAAQASITRPAQFNLTTLGHDVSVDVPTTQFPEASREVRAQLEGVVAWGLNPSLRLASRGPVTISAVVLEDDYHVDPVVVPGMMVLPSGHSFMMIPTSHIVLTGVARARIRFAVLDAQQREVRVVTLSDGWHETPSPDLLPRLRASLVRRFAPEIEPSIEQVSVEYAPCGGDSRCRHGYEAARDANYATAQRWFSQVIGLYELEPVPGELRQTVSDAFFDRGLSRAFAGHTAEARRDIIHAFALRRGDASPAWHYGRELVEWLDAARNRLVAQGVVGPAPPLPARVAVVRIDPP